MYLCNIVADEMTYSLLNTAEKGEMEISKLKIIGVSNTK